MKEVARVVRMQWDKTTVRKTGFESLDKNMREKQRKKKNIEKIGKGERAMSDEKVLYRMKKLKFTRGILVKIHEN